MWLSAKDLYPTNSFNRKEILKGKLILENGMVFEGKLFGDIYKQAVGEVVFNTSMTGYQEILTDPSYYGQIVMLTYPLIGNYGINMQDLQSKRIQASALIIKEPAKLPNNFRCEILLSAYLRQNGVVGLKGVDTRELTKVIRTHGTLKGIITADSISKKERKEFIKNYTNKDAVKNVSRTQVEYINSQIKKNDVKTISAAQFTEDGNCGKKIAVIDFGIKENILNSFLKRGCNLVVFPYNTKAEEIFKTQFDAVFLSNGPGDPQDLPEVITEIKKMAGRIPLIGICLGHQLLALALGGTTTKLKFGHRGANHPVKDIEKNRLFMTAQNHGYVVDKLPENAVMTHYNVNDKSIEGMKSEKDRVLSVQYHPEASPGPVESAYIFDDFLKFIEKGDENVK